MTYEQFYHWLAGYLDANINTESPELNEIEEKMAEVDTDV